MTSGIDAATGGRPRGIDVSNHQRHIDWASPVFHQHGIQFAYIKAGGDIGYRDPYFPQNWIGAKNAGLLRGAYWFYRPSQNPIVEGEAFSAIMGALHQGDLQPAIDIEVSDGLSPIVIVNRLRDICRTVKAKTERDPIIYTYPYFWRTALADSDKFHDLALWIADYNNGASPTLVGKWPAWSFWQTGYRGNLYPAIVGDVDVNVFNGPASQLRKFAGY